MAAWGVGSSLRRKAAPAGALALLGLVVALPAQAGTPTPDPPPLAVAPDPPAAAEPAPVVPVRAAPAAPVRSAPVVRAAPAPAPAPVAKATAKVAVKKKAVRPAPQPVARVPHDRSPVPLAALRGAADRFDRGLLVVAGVALLFVTLGGSVLVAVARRELRSLTA